MWRPSPRRSWIRVDGFRAALALVSPATFRSPYSATPWQIVFLRRAKPLRYNGRVLRERATDFRSALNDNTSMPQTTRQLEARLERLEKELAELKVAVGATKPANPWYREIVGIFAGDEAFVEISRLGRLLRKEKIKG
jgi:hypothetical protein